MTKSIDLRHADEAYKRLVNSLGCIVWEADPSTFQFTFVSAQAEAILGYPVQDWLGDPMFWRRHTHPEDVEWCSAFCRDATRQGRDHQFDYRMIAADGRVVWLRDIVTLTREDGTPRLRGIMLDISACKRAEQELRRSEARYRSLVTATSHSVWTADANGNAYEDAPFWQELTGQTRAQIAGHGWCDAVHPDDRERVAKAWIHSVANGLPYAQEYRVRAHDGTYRIVSVSGAPVRDESGTIVEWIGTCNDVTEPREVAATILQSQKMDSLGRLAGGVAHDFNNLLTVILGYTDFLMADRADGDSVREDVGEIRRAAKHASLLTQQLLAFSRKQLRQPTLIDLTQHIRESSAMLGRLIGEDITLDLILARDTGRVLIDAGQIDQLLMNLVVNARDAMPDGGVITILTEHTPIKGGTGVVPSGDWVRLVVADRGTGMEPDVRAHAFEPFFTTKHKTEGTGLGLSTVYGIVRQAGGHVSIDSAVGQGTSVTILLPRFEAAATPMAEHAGAAASRGRETVLLVEDEDAVRRLAQQALERRGYQVIVAGSGPEALELVRQREAPVDLVLTDVVMPGMSGSEMAQQLVAQRPGLRVLYMSGYTDDAILRHGVLHADVNFIQKPFSPDSLTGKVREVLDRAPSMN